MEKKLLWLSIILAGLLSLGLIIGCGSDSDNDSDEAEPPIAGGTCEYTSVSGVATIVSVEAAGSDETNCSNDPVKVTFSFVPDDATATQSYTITYISDDSIELQVSSANPPSEWVQAEGLTVGSEHPCVRKEITSGTCTPLIFELTDVDYEQGIEMCYEEGDPPDNQFI